MAKRYFEFKDAKSHKFWEVSVSAKKVNIRYGKVGTDGQTSVKELGTPAEAKAHAEKQADGKVKKGYKEAKAKAVKKTAKKTAKKAVKKAVKKKVTKKAVKKAAKKKAVKKKAVKKVVKKTAKKAVKKVNYKKLKKYMDEDGSFLHWDTDEKVSITRSGRNNETDYRIFVESDQDEETGEYDVYGEFGSTIDELIYVVDCFLENGGDIESFKIDGYLK